jgi:hypothetical protein
MIDNIGTEGQVGRHGHTDRDPDRAGARRGERTRGRPARLQRRGLAPGRGGRTTLAATHLRGIQGCQQGLLEPDEWKAFKSGSEGAPAWQRAGATRPNRTTRHQPMSTNINRHLRRPPAVPNAEALARILSAALHQQTQHSPTTPCPHRAGRPPGWPGTRIAAAGPGRAGCGIPPASPKGYHTTAQGQSHMMHAPVPSRAAPGPPRGRVAPGRRDATRAPTCKRHQ